MSSSRKIQATKNYRLFNRHEGENRPLDLKKHKRLVESMKLYGFLSCFPIVCTRDARGHLVVKDGQHRLAVAEALGLTVFWVEADTGFDPAVTSSAGEKWKLRDFAQKHAFNGHRVYQDGLDFAEQHRLPIGTAFALLAGTTSFGNVKEAFEAGEFKAKDRAWADAVVGIYGPMLLLSPELKNQRFLEACMRVCRVKEFDAKRLLRTAERCREKLVNYATLDAYLAMLEEVYNFGCKQMVGLKVAALMAMRDRSPAKKKSPPKNGATEAA